MVADQWDYDEHDNEDEYKGGSSCARGVAPFTFQADPSSLYR